MSSTPQEPGLGSGYNPLVSPQLEDPHPFYSRARREEPVFYNPALGVWVVTRHEDICAVLAEPGRFSSVHSITAGAPSLPPEIIQVLMEGYPQHPSLVDNDPPAHGRLRGLVAKAFTARRISEKEAHIRARAGELIDGLVKEGRADLFDRFAHPLPAFVIASILGIPASETRRFRRWSDDWCAVLVGQGPLEELVTQARGVLDLQRYIAAALEERKASPRDDLLSDIVSAAQAQEPPPSMAELVGMLMQVLFAGHETTAGLIAGAVELLLHHPEQMKAVRSDPGLIPAAVEEAVRMTSPVTAMARTAVEDVTLGGVRIPKGAHLRLAFASANRDEERFHEPQRFDVRRADVKNHIAFGQGIHFCIGAPLARLEARIALELLLQRLPGLRLLPAPSPGFLKSLTIRRIERLDVEWDVPAS